MSAEGERSETQMPLRGRAVVTASEISRFDLFFGETVRLAGKWIARRGKLYIMRRENTIECMALIMDKLIPTNRREQLQTDIGARIAILLYV